MNQIVITLLIGAAGGLAGYYLKIPSGVMIGSMLAVALYNIFTQQAYMPKSITVVLQIVAGAMIGTRMTRETLVGLKDLLVPGIIIIFSVVVINFGIGLLITRFSDLDMATSLFASAPGGQTEMTLAAADFGADTPKVALLQTLRLITVITLLPLLLRSFLQYFPK